MAHVESTINDTYNRNVGVYIFELLTELDDLNPFLKLRLEDGQICVHLCVIRSGKTFNLSRICSIEHFGFAQSDVGKYIAKEVARDMRNAIKQRQKP